MPVIVVHQNIGWRAQQLHAFSTFRISGLTPSPEMVFTFRVSFERPISVPIVQHLLADVTSVSWLMRNDPNVR
jgi:hypothetical protein